MILPRLFVLSAMMLASALTPVSAQAVNSIDILERGIYSLEITKTERTPSGVEHGTVANLCRVANTAIVPATKGIHFGMRFRANGPTPGVPVQIMTVVRFPKFVTPTGGQGPISSYANASAVLTGQVSYWGYGLDHPWEIMPGTWTFEMYVDGFKLAEVVFQVTAGLAAPDSQSDGSECFQVSSL